MQYNLSYRFFDPTHVLFGPGQLNQLHTQPMPGQKALVVISKGKSTRTSGSLDRVLGELCAAGVEAVIFDQVEANPLKSTIEAGARCARDQKCEFVVALGGGSVMDSAKVISMFAPQPGDDLWDYVAGSTGKRKPLVNPVLPVIAITTTAGTGSEVDSWGVITNPDTNEKIAVGAISSMFPVLSIVDPELMVTVPPLLTAYQGFDALFHSTEGYIAKSCNLMSSMIQLTAIENIGSYLVRAVHDGSDLEARTHLAFASTLSGYSMVVGTCTSEHAMEHAMSAYHQDLPHGAGLIMISKAYYSHFVEQHSCDDRFIRMAQALGKTNANHPMDFITALSELQEACGVGDLKMSDYGIQKEECGILAENARTNMRHLFVQDPARLSLEECTEIFVRSYR